MGMELAGFNQLYQAQQRLEKLGPMCEMLRHLLGKPLKKGPMRKFSAVQFFVLERFEKHRQELIEFLSEYSYHP